MTTTEKKPGDEARISALANAIENELCERWSHWAWSRKFYAPAPLPPGTLARLTSRTRPATPGGPDASSSAELWALNLVITSKVTWEGAMTPDRVAFELFYRHKVRNVKATAHALGISRETFYTRVKRFRAMVVREHRQVLVEQKAELARLPHAA